MMSKLPARRPIIKWNNLCGFHYELPRGVKFGGAVGRNECGICTLKAEGEIWWC